MEDEDLLERLLRKDRGREVRRTAAALLARLPESRLVARMGERLLACMTERAAPEAEGSSWTGGLCRAASGLFRRLKAEREEPFAPPETYDPAWAADLVSEKSPTSVLVRAPGGCIRWRRACLSPGGRNTAAKARPICLPLPRVRNGKTRS